MFRTLRQSVALTTFLFSLVASAFAVDLDSEGIRAKVASGALLVDVRSAEEYAAGHVSGAINVPHKRLVADPKEFLGAHAERDLVLYCRSGRRSSVALEALRAAGATRVFNAGGLDDVRTALAASAE